MQTKRTNVRRKKEITRLKQKNWGFKTNKKEKTP